MAESDEGERPAIWTGHIGPLPMPDLDAAVAFYEALGLRRVHGTNQMAALQLRGGTHLVLTASDEATAGGPAPFDLMVDDLDGLHAAATAAGLEPTPIDVGGAHRRFFVTDPAANEVRINDSHVIGPA